MKIWFKYFAAVVLGIVFAVSAGSENAFFTNLLPFLSRIAVQIGRYSVYPAVFFGFTVSVFEMRENKKLFRLAFLTVGLMVIFALLLSVVGIVAVYIFSPARIPIFAEESGMGAVLGIQESFLQLFPSSGFEAVLNGTYILPLCIFAGFAGAGCAVDKTVSKPVVTFFAAAARVSYAVMVFFVDIFAYGMIALSSYWMIQYRSAVISGVFINFFTILAALFVLVAVVLYPALLKLLCPDTNPYRILYAAAAPMLAAFVSGDAHAVLPILLQHSNESLGIRRRISSIVVPVFTIFGRAGSSLVMTVGFIVILKSYSSLGISLQDMIWLAGTAVLFSFLLGRFPAGGSYIALASLCILYGRGFESGYLILRPAAFFIGSVASALNALTAITGAYIVGYRFSMVQKKELRFFV